MTLADLYKKGGFDTDKGTSHDYINSYYSPLLTPFKDQKIRVIEVGTLKGGFLKLCKEYLGSNASIWGIDATVQLPARAIKDCFILLGDGYDKKYVDILPNSADLIIDDGIHDLKHHAKFVELYAPKVKKGGRLVIEDLQHFDQLEDVMALCPEGWQSKSYDFRENKGRFDDVIIEFVR